MKANAMTRRNYLRPASVEKKNKERTAVFRRCKEVEEIYTDVSYRGKKTERERKKKVFTEYSIYRFFEPNYTSRFSLNKKKNPTEHDVQVQPPSLINYRTSFVCYMRSCFPFCLHFYILLDIKLNIVAVRAEFLKDWNNNTHLC